MITKTKSPTGKQVLEEILKPHPTQSGVIIVTPLRKKQAFLASPEPALPTTKKPAYNPLVVAGYVASIAVGLIAGAIILLKPIVLVLPLMVWAAFIAFHAMEAIVGMATGFRVSRMGDDCVCLPSRDMLDF